jgi:hypothetical protein
LDKSVNFGEDLLVLLEVPVLSAGGVFFKHIHLVSTDDFPLLTASNALFQISHAALHVASKHIFLINLGFASGDDLVAN